MEDEDKDKDDVKMIERKYVCIKDIWTECLGGEIKDLKSADSNRIRRIMKRMEGWSDKTKSQRLGNKYGTQKVYYRKNL